MDLWGVKFNIPLSDVRIVATKHCQTFALAEPCGDVGTLTFWKNTLTAWPKYGYNFVSL